ncbi:MAG TPA: FtsX-like permease family protein [Acidimicrobiales bacterium]|jgi:putative ABC transport system permease protein|nr:FtsX-like permease family protein [Acidimicrobiales bacterium]
MTLLRLAIKNAYSKPGRFLLTSLAVLIGVALTTAVFIFTDSLRSTFGDLSDDIESGYDLAVRSEIPFGNRLNAAPIDLDLPAELSKVQGVVAVQPRVIEFGIVPNKADGSAALATRGPNIGINWEDSSPTPRLFVADGREPVAITEFAIDVDTAKDDGFQVGQQYDLQTPNGLKKLTLTGTFTFADPEESASIGAKLVAMDTDSAVELFNSGVGFDDITVSVGQGFSEGDVIKEIQAFLPEGLEVLTRSDLVDEQADTFNQFINIFQTILLVFAFIILIVAAFIIYNVFSIIIGQRIQEIGLLRALGATGKQITNSIVIEALCVGVFATTAGIALGFPIAFGFQELLAALDFGPDENSLPLKPATIIAGAILGIGLTLVAAVWPALKARSISPMAALRSDVSKTYVVPRNLGIGSFLTILGIAAIVFGFAMNQWLLMLPIGVLAGVLLYLGLSRIHVFAGKISLLAVGLILLVTALTADLSTSMLLALLGAAALNSFLGMNLLSPVFTEPVTRFLGLPTARLGVPSKMARRNAGRSPERTASAASALMIGLALVATVSVVSESLKATVGDILEEDVISDWFVQGETLGPEPLGFSPSITNEIAALPEVEEVLAMQYSNEGLRTTFDDEVKRTYSADLASVPKYFNVGIKENNESLIGNQAVYLHEDEAKKYGVSIGSTLPVEFIDQSQIELVVAGIFTSKSIIDSGWLLDSSVYTSNPNLVPQTDDFVGVLLTDGVSEQRAREALENVLIDYEQVEARTKDELKEQAESQINRTLTIVSVLLFISVVLAVLGVAITLALSVFERTREIGLTRAVGATRKQIRRMVRVEGILVALFGGLLGVGLGLVFGIACVQIIPDDFVSELAIPWLLIFRNLVIAGFAGSLAAYFPARRAAKLQVLDAINHE